MIEEVALESDRVRLTLRVAGDELGDRSDDRGSPTVLVATRTVLGTGVVEPTAPIRIVTRWYRYVSGVGSPSM